jgi:two-component system cell cycle sensor histidine kinase PleC
MACRNAASATSHAETIWAGYGFGDGGDKASLTESPWLRRIAFLACAVCLVLLSAFVVTLTNSVHEQILSDASADLDLFSKAVWRELHDAIRDKPETSPNDPLTQLIPAHALTRGRRVFITDAAGKIAAASPPMPGKNVTLMDILGAEQALTEFADKAGVMRVTLADGTLALAMVRRLPTPFGQIAMIHPLESVLVEWRAIAWRYATLFATTTAMLLAIVIGYFHQTRRREAVEKINTLIRTRLETALSRGHCGLWDWDIARGRIYWSDSMYELLGMPAERRWLSIGEVNALVNPNDTDLATIADHVASSEVNSVDREFRIRNAQGAWVWLRARAEIVEDARDPGKHLVGIAVDVSEQKALAEHTATANMRLRDAIEAISEAFVLWDSHNRLVACNSKFLDLHGLAPEHAVLGATYAQIMVRATAPLVQTQSDGDDPRTPNARTYAARLLDGRWLQINERRTKDGGYVSVGADITTLKHNEEKLLDSERRLTSNVAELTRSREALEKQAQQLATLAEKFHLQKADVEAAYLAKSEFLANMSHELRTPLNAIIGFSEMMQGQPFGNLGSPKYLEYCRDIHRSGAYLHEVLSDILDMSRLEAGRVRLDEREVNIADAMHAALSRWRARAEEKNIDFTFDADVNLRCRGDRAAIVKILGILLSNSIKFTQSGGRVRLRARKILGAVDIFVEDSGCGIAKHAIDTLGRPFEQTSTVMENGMKGSGLGLAIARALLDLHSGGLRIRSAVGVGTVVMVRLPVPVAPSALMGEAPVKPRTQVIAASTQKVVNLQVVRSARELAPLSVVAGSDSTTRNPGALSSMRNAP